MKDWTTLTDYERALFKEYCEKKYGEPSTFLGSEKEPLYIDNKLVIVDNDSIIKLLFSYSEN